jgi:hypothetical protein
MAIKKQLSVNLENKPGQLARLCAALSRGKVNIVALAVAENADCGQVRVVTDKAAAARKALAKAKMNATARDVVVVQLTNEPGAMARAAKKLAQAKVNIDYVYGSAERRGTAATCVFAVDDTPKAAKILG